MAHVFKTVVDLHYLVVQEDTSTLHLDVTFVSSSFVVPFFNVFLNEVVYQVGEQVSHSWWDVVPLLLADEGC